MIRCRTATSLLFLAAISSKGATAQTTDLASLRQAVVQAGGRVIVTLKSTRGAAIRAPGSPLIAPDEMDAIQSRIETSYPVQMNTRVPLIGALVLTVSDTELSRLLADPNVAAIEPDVKTYLLPSASSSARPTQIRPDAIPWGITAVGAPSAWAAGITGAGTKVGIIDTGIDYTHPDLSVVGGYDFVSSSSAPSAYADNVASCDGHGTHVAGTVAAKQNGTGVVGVAPNASLYALKVFTDYGSGCFAFLSSQFLAMQWAATNGLDVVNISIGNSNTPSWASAIAQANAAGVVIVAAAGNGGGPGITFPAAITGAIAVAALNGDNTVAGFSSSGPEMWVAAPGVGITSTLPGGGYGDKSGTSMATPHVTGLVALIRQAHPTFTADQVRNELKADAIDVSTPGFDNFSGWGLAQSPPSGASPLSIAVSPAARSISVQQGNAATGDNATVTLSGTNSASTAWSATKKKAWLTLTIASGTGSGTVAWTRNATGLTAGTYVDTITVTAASLTATVYDTLKITAAVVPVTVALSPAARTASVQQGNAAPSDNATVTLSGTNAASTAWSATKKKAWLTLTTASGTGSGTVAWSRNAIGLAVGTYVDTITVTAASSSAVVFDTLKITAAVVPVTVALSPAARSTSVQQGTAAPSDNATATLSGTNAASTAWSAVKKTAWLTLTTASGTGSGTVAWSRNSSGLAVGVYVDTVTVTAASSSAVVYDTLKITTTIVPVTVAVSPAARTVSVQQGSVAPTDNATVTLSGSNASSTAWTATKRHGWLTLTTASGTGSGTVAWSRNATGIGVGTYVDTITVTAASASAVVYDTLKITSAPVPMTVAVSPAARVVSVQQGNAAPGDNALVTLSGTNASSTAWSVTKKKAWLTLTTASGTGSGTVTWSRNAAGLAAGTYVDTLTVTAANASAVVYDTLKVTTVASAQVALDVSPMSRKVSVVQGSAAPGDSMTVTLTGPGAGAVIWWAVKRQPWLVLSNASGTGGGSLMWTRHASTLAVGTYVDTITVSSGSTPSVTVYDTLTITAAVAPIVVAVSPSARSVSLPQGSAAPSDNATVTLTGTGAASTNWVATNRKSWTALTAANGTGNGTLSWTRNAGAMGAGTYVDTITVAAGSATATIIDTMRITAVAIPIAVSVSPSSRSISVAQGSAAPGDNAQVTLTGTGAQGTAWSATHSNNSWLNLGFANGAGNGQLSWTRNAAALAAGTYVDTITVIVTGSSQSVRVFDSLLVTPVAPTHGTIAINPHGRRVRSVALTGSSLNAPSADSAMVESSGVTDSGNWSAAVSSGRLALITPGGTANTYVRWTRSAQTFDPGIYVDTVVVSLQSDPSVRAQFVDSLEVVAVAVPVPDRAVGDLFDHGSLTDDQRVALDRQGNNNGRYDLGDFLAWVSRNHIRLSAAASAKLTQLRTGKVGAP